jgi:CheY-like chemotaxis protein
MIKKKIVIVEDDFLIQELHRHYVTNLGHEVVDCFSTGKEVIEYFKDHTADLILMDIRLEDNIDGIEAMKEIEQLVPVPVVYVSANNEDSSYKRAIQTNMKGFLSKPVVKGDLEKIINDLEDVTDSILYAERIQKAIFIQKEDVDQIFRDNLFLNRPKDIVTGDFCFLDSIQNKKDYIGGIGDCTGHGIPAALLSVLCFQFVTSIAKHERNLQDIIYELNNSIINSLSKVNSKNKVNDSLDVILFRILSESNEIEISGIKREFIHYDSKNKTHNLYRLKGNSLGSPIENKKDIPFMKFKYEKDDYFYFFSDGITDQFGGPSSKKITRKRLIEFLDQTKFTTDFNKKQIEFNMFLRKWQGNNEQTDDMIFLGISPSSFIR